MHGEGTEIQIIEPVLTDQELIAQTLEIWVSCDMNGGKASRITGVNYNILSKWITEYYIPLRRSDDTITLIIPSKV